MEAAAESRTRRREAEAEAEARLRRMEAAQREREAAEKARLRRMEAEQREREAAEKARLRRMEAAQREREAAEKARLRRMEAEQRERGAAEKARLRRMEAAQRKREAAQREEEAEVRARLREAEAAQRREEAQARSRRREAEAAQREEEAEARARWREAAQREKEAGNAAYLKSSFEMMWDADLYAQLQNSAQEASAELHRRIQAEAKARELEACCSSQAEELARTKQAMQQLTMQRDDAQEECERIRSEAEVLRKKCQMLSALVTTMPCQYSSSELEEATENRSSSRIIGEGGFGRVYTGILRNMTVAIKVLTPDSLQGQSQFENEVALLSRLRHPHLVTLIGACSELSAIVYEFVPNGSLEGFLDCERKRQTLTWQVRVRIIAEICSALIFLHNSKPHPVVHGDLKPGNILLDANLVSKLSDFGISRLLIHYSDKNAALYHTTHQAGTHAYMDPEYLATGELTCQSDVYSFGMVVLHLLTGKSPVRIRKAVEDALARGDLNPKLDASAGDWPDTVVQPLTNIALQCTETSRQCRPDTVEVWEAVEGIKNAAPAASMSPPSSSRSATVPSSFLCPIYQEIMDDPHIAADGFTYEADAIRCWLSTGHDTSPMTNLPLEYQDLVPNRALRSAIQEWLQQQSMGL